jgi:hypothetical protein
MDRETRLEVALDLVKEVVMRDGEMPLKTAGLSMRPTVCGGDWLVVRRAVPADIVVGDIAVYQAGPRFVAHRVIRRRLDDAGRMWLTVKGDAHLGAEGELPAENVLATAVAVRSDRSGRILDLAGSRGRRVGRLIARYSSAVDWLYRSVPCLHGRIGLSPDRRARPLAGWANRLVGGLNRLSVRLLLGS